MIGQFSRDQAFCKVSGSCFPFIVANNTWRPCPHLGGHLMWWWGIPLTQPFWTDWSKAFASSVPLLWLTVSHNISSQQCCFPFFLLLLFSLKLPLNLVNTCCHHFCGFAAQDFLLPYTRVTEHFHCFILATGKRWRSIFSYLFSSSFDFCVLKRKVLRQLSNLNR